MESSAHGQANARMRNTGARALPRADTAGIQLLLYAAGSVLLSLLVFWWFRQVWAPRQSSRAVSSQTLCLLHPAAPAKS
jgi:hypothetical protein